jgi:hypothetical protein
MTRWGVVLAAAAAVACKRSPDDGRGWQPVGSAGGGAAVITGWEAGCAAALATARDAPPTERFAIVAKACPACGIDWAPILASTRLAATGHTLAKRDTFDVAIKACGGTCTKAARDTLLDGIEAIENERMLDLPWKRLARDCKDLLWPSPNDRFASAPWYVLTRIARAKVAIAAPVELPLPGQMMGGNGVELPLGVHVLPALPAVHVTVLANQQMVAPAPTVTLGADGLVVAGTEGYPGTHLEPAALAAELATLRAAHPGPVALLAPHAASATRVVDLVTALPAETVHLAVFGPPPAEGWRDLARATIPALAPATDGAAVVIGLGATGRVGARPGPGKSCAQAALDPAELARRATELAKPASLPVVIAVDGAATVDQLAAVLDGLGAAGVTSAGIAPGSWMTWDAAAPACE